ncbi:GyrI-like domain-containing protein [Bacillus sp. es.036]|uniref:GyrI-like domain-containing protein n=1 Tax=Bacillus sp. es.036 TaxID=1761764 RepID=UPI000BF2D9A7|nr:GyrI-like domain-containing protein [Bacillus sp. es.036]PFG12069.1 putative transcriptional regulator YdeE [Bacillus sp. es.036]
MMGERDVHIETLDELYLVGIRVRCPAEEYLSEIAQAAKQLEDRMDEISYVINPTEQMGAFVVEASSEDEEGYWVSYQVLKVEHVPEGMVAITITSQTYAVMKHMGSNKAILHTYDELHNWIEKSSWTRRLSAWHLERFHHFKTIEKIDVDLLDTVQ